MRQGKGPYAMNMANQIVLFAVIGELLAIYTSLQSVQSLLSCVIPRGVWRISLSLTAS